MAFAHIIGLLSFVYALGLTHLLFSVAALLRKGRKVQFSWIYAAWMINAFAVIIADWISFYDLRALPSFSIGTIFFVFALSFTNYLYAAFVAVDAQDEADIDLRAFHNQQGYRYIPAFAVCCVFALAANSVFGGSFSVTQWTQQNLAVMPMTLAAIVACFFVRNTIVQTICLAIVFATWIYYFTALQGALR